MPSSKASEMADAHLNGSVANTRMDSLESALNEVKTNIGKIDTKIDERTKTQWPVLLSAGALVLGTTAYLLNQNSAAISDLKMRLDKDLVTREEHAAVGAREDALRGTIMANSDRLRERIQRIEDTTTGTFNMRDALLEIKEENRQLRDRIEALTAGRAP